MPLCKGQEETPDMLEYSRRPGRTDDILIHRTSSVFYLPDKKDFADVIGVDLRLPGWTRYDHNGPYE